MNHVGRTPLEAINAALADGSAVVTNARTAPLFDNTRPGAVSSVVLTLPWAPSVNHYWRSVAMPPTPPQKRPWVKVLLSEDGRLYQKAVAVAVRLQTLPGAHLEGEVAVKIVLHPPDRRKIDIDNRCKAILDSVAKAGILSDDAQVRDLRVTFGAVKAGGEVLVELTQMGS